MTILNHRRLRMTHEWTGWESQPRCTLQNQDNKCSYRPCDSGGVYYPSRMVTFRPVHSKPFYLHVWMVYRSTWICRWPRLRSAMSATSMKVSEHFRLLKEVNMSPPRKHHKTYLTLKPRTPHRCGTVGCWEQKFNWSLVWQQCLRVHYLPVRTWRHFLLPYRVCNRNDMTRRKNTTTTSRTHRVRRLVEVSSHSRWGWQTTIRRGGTRRLSTKQSSSLEKSEKGSTRGRT